MIVDRRLVSHIKSLMQYYPIISLTGPRQAGKTTLLRMLFADYTYISFEIPDERRAFEEDPRGYLRRYNEKVIFDEAQNVPELFSYLQTDVDLDRRPGRFILSGSQNFLLHKRITQSLAGRIGIARLLPLDIGELKAANVLPERYEDLLYRGSYPAQFSTNIPPEIFYPDYVYSYVQRDVAEFIDAANLSVFQRFLRIVAGHAGQLANYSNMATAVGVSVPTIKSWLSILEQSYIIFQLDPYYKNITRRLVKSPKIYFYDTGLLCYLLEIRDPAQIRAHYQFGNIFENLIVADAFKTSFHLRETPMFTFFRDSNGGEIDLVYERASRMVLHEIKANETGHPRLARPLNRLAESLFPDAEKRLIYAGDNSITLNKTSYVPWREVEWSL